MKIDMENLTTGVIGHASTGMPFSGIKLPNDGKIGFLQLQKLEISRQLLIEWISGARQRIRPWSSFFATSNYNVPTNAQRLPQRIIKNVDHFQSNYLFVFIGLFIYCLVTSPFLFLVILAVFSFSYWIITNEKLPQTILGQRLTLPQQCSLIGLCSMPVLYLAGAGAVLFWVLGASFFLITTHAVFYDIQSVIDSHDEGFELKMEQVV